MSTRRPEATGAHVLIPVKHLDRAKSRLAPNLTAAQRKQFALAMLEDTIRAAAASPAVGRITVVTPDESAARHARACGSLVLEEEAAPDDAVLSPLNAALDAAARRLRADFAPATLVVLQADLPALRTAELTAAITGATGRRAVVADHAGTGTTALIVRGADLDPRFGRWSALEHQRGGAAALTGHWPGLRRDVDTAEDLRHALLLGVGPATSALLTDLDDIDWNTA